MKTKRFVSTLLALLLVCSLPVSAFADTIENTGPLENNNGYLEVNASTGTITNNNGTVIQNHGSITNNCEGGVVDNNYSAVGTNDGDIVDNGINDHGGTVGINNGQVEHNNELSTVTTNNGTVTDNYGTVKTNKGTVEKNGGTVDTNGGTVTTNNGTVTTNSSTGTVTINYGTVTTNRGTVTTNNGTVNNDDGSVIINNTTGTVKEGRPRTNYGTVKLGDTTWYGVLVDNDGTKTLEEYCTPGQVLDFSKLTKEGYVYAGYTQEYQLLDGVLTKQALTVSDTSYTVTCPNVLTLIWQAIFSPAADDGTGSFGPGSVISINGHKFLLVAVVEDVYCLASVESFEEEQLTHVTGEAELLDEELTARFFGGEGSHIVFPCDSSLIFS